MTLGDLAELLPTGLRLEVGEEEYILTLRNMEHQNSPHRDRYLKISLEFLHETEHAIMEANKGDD